MTGKESMWSVQVQKENQLLETGDLEERFFFFFFVIVG